MLTYGALERRSNQLARFLMESGVRPGDRVGLFLNKSAAAIVGIYGILKTGAAYVPLDPFAPAARLAYITRDCGIRTLVTGREKAAAWAALAEAGTAVEHLVVVSGEGEGPLEGPSGMRMSGEDAIALATAGPVDVPAIDQDLAYILYTSGSTGQPKGVMISHLNALTFVRWCGDYFAPTKADVLSNHAPLHFDLTILDIYVAALAGATMVVVPPEVSVFPRQLAALIREQGITIWYSVPSALSMLVLHANLAPGDLPSLRQVIFAGEVFPTKHLRALMRLVPQAQFTNLYGPTETNVCTYYRVPALPEEQTEAIPIGRAIANVEVFAVREDDHRAAPGEVGELFVRGSTVAYGYWGDRERTQRGFIQNPLGPVQDRAYRTGDLVIQRPDGDYQFLGRKDHQIKSRGYRIEIGDIETALYAHPDVTECAVIPVPDEEYGNRIKAFVVSGTSKVTAESLESLVRHLARLLPKYMIPESFEIRSGLPKTSTGKIDRTALAGGPVGARADGGRGA